MHAVTPKPRRTLELPLARLVDRCLTDANTGGDTPKTTDSLRLKHGMA